MRLHLIRHELPRMSPAWIVGYSERTDRVRQALELQYERTGHTNVLLDVSVNSLDNLPGLPHELLKDSSPPALLPRGTPFTIEHDGFAGLIIGHYERLDGVRGIVGQQTGNRVVHVYGEKWLKP